MKESFELYKAQVLLIKHKRAYVKHRLESGEFGDPFPINRDEIQKINLTRNNLIGYGAIQVLDMSIEELTESLFYAMKDANAGKWSLGESEASEFYDLWVHFYDQK